MGSSYSGEPSLGNGRSSSGGGGGGGGGGSSRKGKKNNSDKPKQPQRGLGVAQLEKIRLHNQMNCNYLPSLHAHHPYHTNLNQEDGVRMETTYSSVPSSSCFAYSSTTSSSSASPFGFHPNIMMGMGELDVTENRYGGDISQSSTTARWNYNNGIIETQYPTHPDATKQFLSLHIEDSGKKKRGKDRYDLMGTSNQRSSSSETQEIDLDLKLSL